MTQYLSQLSQLNPSSEHVEASYTFVFICKYMGSQDLSIDKFPIHKETT